MSSNADLARWVQAQYQIFGVDQKGHFIGKRPFKNRLIDRYLTVNGGRVPKQEIRQLVNWLRPFPLSLVCVRPHRYQSIILSGAKNS